MENPKGGLGSELPISGGGSGLVLDGFTAGTQTSDKILAIPCDGAPHAETPTITAPPAWLDAAGNVILPGLYAVTALLEQNAAAAAPVLIELSLPFNAHYVVSSDELAFLKANALGPFQPCETQSLIQADLPYALSFSVFGENDVTANVNLQYIIQRLAH